MTGFGSLPLPPTTDTELFCASMNQEYMARQRVCAGVLNSTLR